MHMSAASVAPADKIPSHARIGFRRSPTPGQGTSARKGERRIPREAIGPNANLARANSGASRQLMPVRPPVSPPATPDPHGHRALPLVATPSPSLRPPRPAKPRPIRNFAGRQRPHLPPVATVRPRLRRRPADETDRKTGPRPACIGDIRHAALWPARARSVR